MTKTASMTAQPPGFLMRVMAAGVLAVAAAITAVPAHAQGHNSHGHRMGGEGSGSVMMFGGSPEHVTRTVDHLLDGLGATDAQRTQIKQIATAAAADMKTQREATRGMREKGLQLFTAPTVDAAAAEALRQQMSAQQDQTSKRQLQAMLDVSKVLTPEQRARLGERMTQRKAQMHDRAQREQRERSTEPRSKP